MKRDQLWSERISPEWIEGLPIGNGRIGTMVTGCPGRDRLTLNHDDLWQRLVDRKTVPVSGHLAGIRKACAEGRWEEAQALTMEKLQPIPSHPDLSVEEYQIAGDVVVKVDLPVPVKDYRRGLDLATGVAEVSFSMGANRQRRRYCASAPDRVIAMEISNLARKSLRCDVVLSCRSQNDWIVRPETGGDGIFGYTVQSTSGPHFSVACRVTRIGGDCRFDISQASIVGADSIAILLSVVTYDENTSPWAEAARRVGIDKSVDHVFKESVADHQRYYRRVDLTLDRGRRTSPSTDAMLAAALAGKPDRGLFEALFKLGRYLTIASSRPGTNPINLQGIWNNDLHPAWQSDWHFDINIEMCYWLSESCNLSECAGPLFDLIERMLPAARRNAADLFGCRGVFFPIACTRDAVALPGWWVAWTGAAGWLAQHFWQHYEYSGDAAFLKESAYPFFKTVLEFYEDFLIPDHDGKLMMVPSLSPENIPANRKAYVCKNAVCDIAIVSELIRNAIAAARILGVDSEMIPRWEAMRDRLPSWPVDREGSLKEWADPSAEENPKHRHFSHLYPLYPGDLFTTEDTPDLAAAASKALEARESRGYEEMAGWSYPNLAALHARLGQGNEALQALEYLAQSCLMSNLLTAHNDWRFQGLSLFWDNVNMPRLFMIDAILGTTAAIAEMLLQSHGDLIRILPALPDTWHNGRVTGLKARGGFEVDIEWNKNSPTLVRIKSALGKPCHLKLGRGKGDWRISRGGTMLEAKKDRTGILHFDTSPGRTYLIVPVAPLSTQ